MNALARSLAMFPLLPTAMVAVSLGLLVSPYPYSALLPGLSVPFLLWFGQRSRRACLFYGIVALIPFGAYRALGGESGLIRLHWLLAGVLIMLLVVEIFGRRSFPAELRHGRFWCLVLGFYTINILAATRSPFPAVSIQFMALLAAGYLLVAMGMLLIDHKGYVQTLPGVIIGSILVGSALAVLGYALHLKVFVSPVSGRATGGAPDPNNLSLMIIFSLPLAVYFLLTARRPWVRLALLLVIGINILTVALTFSRGGAIMLGLASLLILWNFHRLIAPRNLGLLLGVGGLAVCVLLLLLPASYGTRLKSVRDTDDFAINRRLSYLVVARDLFAQRPFLGHGPDTFSSLYSQTEIGRSFKRKHETGRRKAHNTYVEVLVGSGLVGLAFFAAILLYALRCLNRARRIFLTRGMAAEALLTGAYRTAFISLLMYLAIFSDVYHKYLLLSLAVSQVALRLAQQRGNEGVEHARR